MKRFNDWLALLANVAVVAGIVFLGLELRQNTTAVMAQTRDSIAEKEMEYYGWLATNADLASIAVSATTVGVEALSETEKRMWIGFTSAVFREWENANYQYRAGLFTEDEYEGRLSNMRNLMKLPGFQWAWASQRSKFSHAFRDMLDVMVEATEPR